MRITKLSCIFFLCAVLNNAIANITFSDSNDSVLSHYYEAAKHKHLATANNNSKADISLDKKPGRIIGTKTDDIKNAIDSDWKYRAKTYELYFSSQHLLAESVYSLAKYAKDISTDTPLEKVKKGVSAFHYSSNQICGYIEAVHRGEFSISANEQKLIDYFTKDGVVTLINGKCVSQYIEDIVGASASKKRSLSKNLNHERLHIYWDKDDSLRRQYVNKWNSLTDEQKQKVKDNLKQYNVANTDQIIEEWAIYDKEKELTK